MSWTKIAKKPIKTGQVSGVAIAGHDGQLWGSAGDFNPSQEEVLHIVSGFTEEGLAGVQMAGVKAEGKKYFFLNVDTIALKDGKDSSKTPNVLRAKKDVDGIVAVKTKQAVVVSLFKGGAKVTVDDKEITQQLGPASNETIKVAQKLVGKGF